jgi:hypothetical protein
MLPYQVMMHACGGGWISNRALGGRGILKAGSSKFGIRAPTRCGMGQRASGAAWSLPEAALVQVGQRASGAAWSLPEAALVQEMRHGAESQWSCLELA